LKTKLPNIRLIYTCGLIPLIGGLTIFFSWWVGKAFFTKNLNGLESLGFLWMLISFVIAIVGIIFSGYNFFKYKDKYLKQTLIGLFIILLNLPVVNWVLDKQSEIEKRTYVKFINKSQNDNLTLIIYDTKFKKLLGTIDNNQSIIEYYVPTTLYGDDSAPIYDSLKLVVLTNQIKDTLQLSEFYPGECRKVFLDKDFKVKSTW
jgi:uncharacterized membrane protein